MPRERGRWRDCALSTGAAIAVLMLMGALGWLVVDLLATAWPRLGWELITELPRRSGRAGGISSILVSTFLIVLVCWAAVLPIASGAAIALADSQRPWAQFVSVSLDLLAGLPSILLGLFGMILFGDLLGLGFSIACGGLTLACMVLPLVTRMFVAALQAVPASLTANAAALGLTRTTTLTRIIMPVALPGMVAAVALGTARALAETAALIFTSGLSDRMPTGSTDPGRTLAVHIYDLAMNVAGGDPSAAASACVLVSLLVLIQLGSGLARKQLQARLS